MSDIDFQIVDVEMELEKRSKEQNELNGYLWMRRMS